MNETAGAKTPKYKGGRCSLEILKRTPHRDQNPVLWAWLEFFSPLRGTNSKAKPQLTLIIFTGISDDCFEYLLLLKLIMKYFLSTFFRHKFLHNIKRGILKASLIVLYFVSQVAIPFSLIQRYVSHIPSVDQASSSNLRMFDAPCRFSIFSSKQTFIISCSWGEKST